MGNWKELVSADLIKVEEAMVADIATLENKLDPLLLKILKYSLFSGGKRVRPLLAILASRIDGDCSDSIYELAIAFEYLHVATLIHDDVIDRADYRRGKPTVVKQFGMVEAILAGDFLHARSMEIVGEKCGAKGLTVFCEATCGMVDGEFIQLRNSNDYSLSEKDYFSAITGKTVMLISSVCEIGVIYGGGDPHTQSILKKYGTNLGAAFQIVDDLLDYLGSESETGKAVGNDLVEGKVTLPLILALQNMKEVDRKEFLEVLQDDERRKKMISQVTEIITVKEGFSQSKVKAQYLIEEAITSVSSIANADTEVVDVLTGLAKYVLSRKK